MDAYPVRATAVTAASTEGRRIRSELEDAWAAVHDALPVGWVVNRPSGHVEDDRWHVFAADHPPGRKRPDYVQSVRMDEANCLRGLADLRREWQVDMVVGRDDRRA